MIWLLGNPLGLVVPNQGGAPFGRRIGTRIGSFLESQLILGFYVLIEIVSALFGTTWACSNFAQTPKRCPNFAWGYLGLFQLHLGMLKSIPTHFQTTFHLALSECPTFTRTSWSFSPVMLMKLSQVPHLLMRICSTPYKNMLQPPHHHHSSLSKI